MLQLINRRRYFMKTPDPKVMRAVFNDPKALGQLSNILVNKTIDNKITIDKKTYIVHTSSSEKKSKD
jgi:hypothetical protein